MSTTTTKHPMNGKPRKPAPSQQSSARRFGQTRPALEFTPTAWLKLQFLCHLGETEIGGFGVMADPTELLVTEFGTVKQQCTPVGVSFDDQAVADYFEQMVDRDLKPDQFARCWLHTHPGDSPEPSGLDEDTFDRVFGRCDWAIMFILARGGATYCRLRFNAGPGAELLLPIRVRWDLSFGEVEQDQWRTEYEANIAAEPTMVGAQICERGHRLDVIDPPWGERAINDLGPEFASFDFGFDLTEADHGLAY